MGVGASLLTRSVAAGIALSGVWWAGYSLRRSLQSAKPHQAPLIRRESSASVESDSRTSRRRRKKELKKSESVTAEELMRMGICYGEQGRLGKAMGKFLEAKGAFEDERATECPGYANLLAQIGIWYGMQSRKREEMEKYTESQKVFRKIGTSASREYAGLLKNMGIWFMEQGRRRFKSTPLCLWRCPPLSEVLINSFYRQNSRHLDHKSMHNTGPKPPKVA